MPYFAPYIDSSGLHIPTYQDIEDFFVSESRRVFGQDIFLGADSQDFQDITVRAKAAYDMMLAAQLAYNNRSPVSAIRAGLDAIVAINGVKRQAATFSIASVTLTGTAFTLITNGAVADVNGKKWNLPASVTIGAGGTVTVTATCDEEGPVTATIGQISIILTPTQGWTAVTNPAVATPGVSAETDASLKSRQAVSVANPSQSLTTGVLGAVLAVSNVVSAQLYENDYNIPLNYINGVYNPGQFPAKSMTLVVDGGAAVDVATAIALRKTPGCYTNGDQSLIVPDRFGVPITIRWYNPTTKTIDVSITLKALSGYNSAIGDAVKQAVVDYINSLVAGESVIISALEREALKVDTSKYPVFSMSPMQVCIHGDSLGSVDLAMNFNWRAITALGNISLTVL